MNNIKIRSNVFETNSSSSHSLTIKTDDLAYQPFSQETLVAGHYLVDVDDYGWEWERYYTLKNKLKYLVTQIFNGSDIEGSSIEDATERGLGNLFFNNLYTTVLDYTGIRICLNPNGKFASIDHESVSVTDEVLADCEKLRHLLFSENSYIETGNDNSGPPKYIHTDVEERGDELYFPNFYKNFEKDGTEKYFGVVLKKGKLYSVEKSNLKLIPDDSDFYEALTSDGIITEAHQFSSARYEYNGDKEEMSLIRDLTVGTTDAVDGLIPVYVNVDYHTTHIKNEEQDRYFKITALTVALPYSVENQQEGTLKNVLTVCKKLCKPVKKSKTVFVL